MVFVLIIAGGLFTLMPLVVRTQPWILTAWTVGWSAAFIALVIAKGDRFW